MSWAIRRVRGGISAAALLGACLLSPVPAPADGAWPTAPEPPKGLVCLVAAYPEHLERAEPDGASGWVLVWKDGLRMAWDRRADDGKKERTFEERLENPDLADQLSIPYPPAGVEKVPDRNEDPGRIRYEPFFMKMYGGSAGEVRKRLGVVRWVEGSGRPVLKATTVNGVHKALEAVARDIEKLPAEMRRLAGDVSGPFHWRKVKGTKRHSAHSWGIAMDIGVKDSDFWRWARPGPDGLLRHRKRIPKELVEAFEKHGFIWGGRWYHFDTMHFEYRPELLDARCR